MKPVTPQEYAAAYGVFIADMLIIAPKLPAIITWFNANLPDVALVYKTNLALFAGYTPSINSFPSKPVLNKFGSSITENRKADAYNRQVDLAWTAITIDLKAALTTAEVSNSASILASFAKLKPWARGLK